MPIHKFKWHTFPHPPLIGAHIISRMYSMANIVFLFYRSRRAPHINAPKKYLTMLHPNVIQKNSRDLSNLHQNFKLHESFTRTLPRCVQSAGAQSAGTRFAGAKFTGAQFGAPTFSRGPICHSTKKRGAQFAAKLARGPICRGPIYWSPMCLGQKLCLTEDLSFFQF